MSSKKPIVDTFRTVMPPLIEIACTILRVPRDTLITYREIDNGGIVVITGSGQKFTFTAEDLADPKTVRAQLKAKGLIR